MPKIFWWVKISTLEVMMLSSLALTAQAAESVMENSHLFTISPVLISQKSYRASHNYEQKGDEFYTWGMEAYENGQLGDAYYYFEQAAINYEQCYYEMERMGDSGLNDVADKYDYVVALLNNRRNWE